MNIRTTANENGHQELRIVEAAGARPLNAGAGQAAGPGDLHSRVDKVVAAASAHAAAVDRKSRFPQEAFDAARAEHLLGFAVPASWAGKASASPMSRTFATGLARHAHRRR